MVDTSAHVVVPGEVLFRLTESALIAANSGAAFTREGVISVCHMHLGKGTEQPKDEFGYDPVYGIAKAMMQVYRANPHLLVEHGKGEKTLSGDYNGRSMWELLQNADDAATVAALGSGGAAGQLIGAKGLGFKSILEISESPEIYSGEFNFRFSREDTRKALAAKGVDTEYGVPAFRMPHKCKPDDECSRLIADGYATVVRLPFCGDKAKTAEMRLNELDATCLLFCQRLSRINIEIRGESRILEIDRNGVFGFEGGDAIFALTENGAHQAWRRWSSVWTPQENGAGKRLSAALCLPIGKNGKPEVMKEERPVHVFFPTNRAVRVPKLRALAHASYEVKSDREHFQEGDCQPYGESIRGKIGDLAGIVMERIPAAAALRVFGEIRPTNEQSEIGKLQNTFASAVARAAFVPVIGGSRVTPSEARLWKHDLGDVLRNDCEEVRNAQLLAPALNRDKEIRDILSGLDAKSVGGEIKHAELLRFCENDGREQCGAAFRVASSIVQAAGDNDNVAAILKTIPLWWTDNSIPLARALTGDPPLLWRHPGRDNWPEWLPVDFLSPEFTGNLADEDRDAMKKSMGDDWPLSNKRRYFKKAMLPFCHRQDAEWWEENWQAVLGWTEKWMGDVVDEEQSPMIVGEDDERNQAGKIARLPTVGGEFTPAIECYSGAIFADIEGAGVVRAEDISRWGKMFTWLGVSRVPKLRRVGDDVYQFDQRALEALQRESAPKKILGIICEMAELAHDKPFAFSQLQNADLIPCKPGILRPENKWIKSGEVYMPGCGVKGYFPEVAADIGEKMWEWLPRLGALKELPPSSDTAQWRGYMERLADLAAKEFESGNDERLRWNEGEKGNLARVILRLYQKYGASLVGMGKIPFLRIAPSGAFIDFAPFESVRWMDKDYHHDSAVYMDILAEAAGFKIFPFAGDKGRPFQLPELTGNMEWLHYLVDKMPSERLRWNRGGEDDGDVAKFIRDLYGKEGDNRPQCDAYAPFLRRDDGAVYVGFAPAREIYRADKPYHEETKVRDALLREGFKIFPFFLSAGEWSGLNPLSDAMSEHPVPGGRDDAATKELRRRFSDRRKVFEVLLRRVCGISSEAPPQSTIQGYASLNLVLNNQDGRKIVQSPIDASVHNAEILVNVGNSRWRALADGLTQWWDVRAYSADFEGILRDKKPEDWVHRLRKWGISEEDLSPLEEPPTQISETPSGIVSTAETRTGAESTPTPSEPPSTTSAVPSSSSAPITATPNRTPMSSRPSSTLPPPPTSPTATNAGPASSTPTSRRGSERLRSDEHKNLQAQILKHPEIIGLCSVGVDSEYEFPSGDKVDLLFTTNDEYVAVEVKPRNCPDHEVVRGAYQCVKYDALLKAAIKLNRWPLSGRTIFALGGTFPPDKESIRRFLVEAGIEIRELCSD